MQRHAAAGDDAFFDRRAGGVQRVLDAGLLLLHLGLGRRADLDDRHAAGELRQPLLQLLAVVVGGGLLDLRADLLDAALDRRSGLPAPSMIVVLSLSIVTCLAWPRSSSLTFSSLMPRSSVIALPPVRIAMSSSIALRRSPKPGALTAAAVQRAAQLVDDQRRQRLALDVLGDDQQRLAGAGRPARAAAAGPSSTLIFFSWIRMNGVLEHHFHPLRVGHEVGREVAAVELHALDDLERGLDASWPPRR